MRKLEIDEIKSIAGSILRDFKIFCDNNEIVFYLAYGTLLGAVRHEGFIPWDDDVDVFIKREDYNRLLELWDNDKEFPNTLVSIHNNEKYNLPLAKVYNKKTILRQNYKFKEKVELGVYIDLFILDAIPNDEKGKKKLLIKATNLRKKWFRSARKLRNEDENFLISTLKWIGSLPFIIKGERYYLKKIDKLNLSYHNVDTGALGNLDFGDLDEKACFPSTYFIPSYLKFEGEFYCVPKEYDKCLKKQYGNYMLLPPETQRISNHNYSAFYK